MPPCTAPHDGLRQAARRVVPLLVLLLASVCTRRSGARLERFELTRPEMGMPFRIVLYASDPETARAAATAALDHVRELNRVFSDYEDDSELTLLSHSAGQGRTVPVSPHLWAVLSRAQALAIQSQGAFDVTVGPYVQLWRRARRQRQLPRADLLEKARAAVGYTNLVLDTHRRTARLAVPGMRLDLGAIAKGYAIDEALRVLRERGIRSALVTCGGDMAASEPPPGRKGWRVEVPLLDTTNAPPAEFVLLTSCALATSGDLNQHVEIDGRRYSHIVDPRTGIGLTDRSLVTVIAPDCTTADSLATTLSVLGPEKGMALAESSRGVAARFLRKPLDIIEFNYSRRYRRQLVPATAAEIRQGK